MISGRWGRNLRRLLGCGAGFTTGMAMWAAQVTPNTHDTLTYKDGDRVQGVLIEQTPEIIVFKSDRFGELRVAAADAVVIKAEKATGEAAKSAAGVAQTTPSPAVIPPPIPPVT